MFFTMFYSKFFLYSIMEIIHSVIMKIILTRECAAIAFLPLTR